MLAAVRGTKQSHGQQKTTRKDTHIGIEANADHDDVIISEDDSHGPDQDTELWDENDTVQPVNILSPHPIVSGKPITSEHAAFSDLRGVSIATSTAHT